MESIINAYISQLVSKPELLPMKNDSPLLTSRILDSLSVLGSVLFLKNQFGGFVHSEALLPEHFETVEAICTYRPS